MPFDPFEQESADDQFFDAWQEYEEWSQGVDSERDRTDERFFEQEQDDQDHLNDTNLPF